jgi:hypothetical protein
MKVKSLPFVILLFSVIAACTKPGMGGCDPGNMNGSMSLTGKWQVMQDSISNSWLKTSPVITYYIGAAGDYFDFRSDGFCYTKEGDAFDTLAYKWVSPQSIVVQNFGLVINGATEPSVLSRTATTATITTQNILSPSGTIFREVNLKR